MAQGTDLAHLLRPAVRAVRDGQAHVALLGFPIPRVAGGPTKQLHWQALQLPVLSRPGQRISGFRPNEAGFWWHDEHTAFASDRRIEWLPTENWHPTELTTRGRFPEPVASRHVLLLGAGALGSAVAEMLIRAGVGRMTVVDDDVLEAGNLVRHTLTLAELGQPKATALAARLNAANPHARVDAFPGRFPPEHVDNPLWQQPRVIVDTTGSNEVAADLTCFPWDGERLFVSLSLGLGAHRLYLYAGQATTFPADHFRNSVDPLAREDFESSGPDLPREGTGCWHPVFPARADDIWLLAAAAIKLIVGLMEQPPREACLRVIEQRGGQGDFSGVRVR